MERFTPSTPEADTTQEVVSPAYDVVIAQRIDHLFQSACELVNASRNSQANTVLEQTLFTIETAQDAQSKSVISHVAELSSANDGIFGDRARTVVQVTERGESKIVHGLIMVDECGNEHSSQITVDISPHSTIAYTASGFLYDHESKEPYAVSHIRDHRRRWHS